MMRSGSGVDVVVDEQARVREGLERLVGGFLEQLPAIASGVFIFGVFVVVGWVMRRGVRRLLLWRTERSSFAEVVSRLVRLGVVIVGLLVALVIAVPSVNLGQVVANLGLTSVALGFAFKDILQNSLAGLLLLFREPFRTGDEIEVDDWRGVVEAISIRETRVRTFDNRRLLIANTDIYGKVVAVQTAYTSVRTVLSIGIDYDGDLDHAQRVVLDATRAVDGVLTTPACEAHFTSFEPSILQLELRFWTAPFQRAVNAVTDRVVQAVKAACDAEDVALPADIVEVDLRTGARRALSSLGPGTAD
jgi:small-conductance mechanosensitive channel